MVCDEVKKKPAALNDQLPIMTCDTSNEEFITGKQFRDSLKRPRPKPRYVPAFTIQTLQRNTVVVPRKRINYFREKMPGQTLFQKKYDGGELPLKMSYAGGKMKIVWEEEFEKMDYHVYLPLFFEGLLETEMPYYRVAMEAIKELVVKGGHKVLPVVPQLIIPIRRALDTRNPKILCQTMKTIQRLVMAGEMVGEALVPYYRQLLPVMNLFFLKNNNLWEDIDNSPDVLGDVIGETLRTLERYGGEDAFINIKYMVPVYESCMMN